MARQGRNHHLLLRGVLSALLLGAAVGCDRLIEHSPLGTGASPAPLPISWWVPALSTSWQWQLTGLPVDQTVDVAMYDIDLFDNPASVVAALHGRGRRVVCYLSAGTWEDWRPDAARFPATVLGARVRGWAGERWIDIRQLETVMPLMEARMNLCKDKGFDAIEPDNIDGYSNASGFPLTASDQLRYNIRLSTAAHARGLSIGLKNDLEQVPSLVSYFDWALTEQCFEHHECDRLAPFTKAGKAVFAVEYHLSTAQFCPSAVALRFNAMVNNVKLDALRSSCPSEHVDLNPRCALFSGCGTAAPGVAAVRRQTGELKAPRGAEAPTLLHY